MRPPFSARRLPALSLLLLLGTRGARPPARHPARRSRLGLDLPPRPRGRPLPASLRARQLVAEPRMRPEPRPAHTPASIAVPDVCPPELVTTRRSARERPDEGGRRRRAPALPASEAQGAAGARAPPRDRRAGPLRRVTLRAVPRGAARGRGLRPRRLGRPPARAGGAVSPAKDARGLRLGRQPAAERPLVMHLAQLAWIDERSNVCFLGPRGPERRTWRSPSG